MIKHPFKPLYDDNSKIVILGSFPSVKSREQNFYYGHPQNRFWKVISAVFEASLPVTIEEKKEFLLANNIALWDVIASCEINGSSDASISDVVTNDIKSLLDKTGIERVFCNGNKSYELYCKYAEKETGISAVKLPSTSPANAAWSSERLIETWRKAVKDT